MSGLLAALLLRHRGWDVDVYERVEGELAGRGAGIVAQPELIETLARPRHRSRPISASRCKTKNLRCAMARLTGEIACPQTLTAWERVYRLLRDALPAGRYHRGIELARFDAERGSV